MRELAKLLVEMRKLEPKIKSLFDTLQPEHYDLLTQATKMNEGTLQKKQRFAAPTYAMNTATSLNDYRNIPIIYALRRKNVFSTVSSAKAEVTLRQLYT